MLALANNSHPILDRSQRDGLAEVIEQFLSEQTTANTFRDATYEFYGSKDPTVQFVAQETWGVYDDFEDHLVSLSKTEWNYFQRLLLLLNSNHQVTTTLTRRWSWTQPAAAITLLAFACPLWQYGWGMHLLIFSIPFGIISILLSYLRSERSHSNPYHEILTPFASFTELSTTYRATSNFKKTRYPNALTKRRLRSWLANFGMYLHEYSLWLILAPAPLFIQMFPKKEILTSVTLP